MKLLGCDLIPRVSDYIMYCLREWQGIWSNCVNKTLCHLSNCRYCWS